MRLGIITKLFVGFAFALVLIIVIGLTSYNTFSKQAEEEKWIAHTYEVINQIDRIHIHVYEMRFAARSFLYTKDSVFFNRYKEQAVTIRTEISSLERIVNDDPVQLRRVYLLNSGLNDLTEYLERSFSSFKLTTKEDIVRITSSMQPLVDSIHNQFTVLTTEENRLLSDRDAKNQALIKDAVRILVIDIALILLMVAVLIYFILNEFDKRRKAEETSMRNVERLEQLNKESSQQNWLLTGLTKINVVEHGESSVSEICESLLTSLLQYLELPAGAFYSLIEGMEGLQLVASIATTSAKSTSIKNTLGENTLTAKKIVVIKNVPADYWSIQSALGKKQPGEIAYIPLIHNETVNGVIELATFNSFSEQQINFLELVSNNASIALYSAQSRRKIKNLLRQLGQQNDELINQHEELFKTNEELERQTETLQKSEEELKVQEEELRKINEELLERNDALELARQTMVLKNEELENASKYKSEFLANMSHELRTPLNSILILSKQLSENKTKNLTPKQVEYGNIIYKSGADLLDLINDMLDLSKIEAGKIDLHYEETKTENIVQDMQEMFNAVAKEKDIKFITSIEPLVPEFILTDRQRLEQIVKNLLSNAFKFTEKKGEVKLSFSALEKDGMLHITVMDTGIGIPKEKQQLIFEAFQQADSSTNRKYGGTGLGLSICKELIRLLNGEIHVQSEERKGSTFTVYLPLTLTNKPALTKENDTTNIASNKPLLHQKISDDRNTIGGNEKVILIIEDDVQFASLLRDFAREHGYKAIIAVQGDEGLLFAKKYKPDAIILDIKLPVIDGWTILRLLKDDEALKHIPVHVISGSDYDVSANANVISYLKKPVDKQDIENAFETLMENTLTKFKRILILSGEHLNNDSLKKLIEKGHFDVVCTYVHTIDEMLIELDKNNFDGIIADIGKELSKAKNDLKKLKGKAEKYNLPVIVYIDADISSNEELELMKVSDVVIREAEMSKNRLMDELELFFYKVDESKEHVQMINETGSGDEKIFKDKKVLLVDDDMRNIFVLTNILEENKMKVIPAVNGKDAINELRKNPDVHIVLMDVMMPEMDGYEAMRKIRNEFGFTSLPIIALTAKAMKDDKQMCIEAGASDYITKPLDINKLLSLMRVWLAQ